MSTSKASNHATASGITQMKSSRSPSQLLNWQSRIRCCIDCIFVPQSHSGLSLNFRQYMSSLQLPYPMRIRLSLTQIFLGRSIPKTRVHMLSTRMPPSLSISHSACHSSGVLTLYSVMILAFNKNGFRDLSLGLIVPSLSIVNSWCLSFLSFSFSTLFCLLIQGSSMLARQGSHCLFMLKTVPDIVHMALVGYLLPLCGHFLPKLGSSILRPSRPRLRRKSGGRLQQPLRWCQLICQFKSN